jgi:tRNA G10  N-methylase Trm11
MLKYQQRNIKNRQTQNELGTHQNVKVLATKETAYVFAPGKNWKLSLAELVTFLKAREFKFKVADFSKSFFIITTEDAFDPSLVDYLGGIIKTGRILSQIPLKTVEEAFFDGNEQALAETKAHLLSDYVLDELFATCTTKCLFGVSLYSDSSRLLRFSKGMQRFVGSCFKDELTSRGIRAKFMGFPKRRELPQLTHVEVLKKGLIEKGAEILFCLGREDVFVSKTVAVHNPFEFQKRDVGRPVQRKIFSIPPRLAKIMVNLSMCLPGKVLLDPFCGVGTILQEALINKARVIGMDKNHWCVETSRTNLHWLENEYDLKEAEYTIQLGDARDLTEKIGKGTVDCIVTEPDLGPPLRHFPTESYAKEIIQKLKPLYCDFLEGAYKALAAKGNLVFTTPYIRARSGSFVTLELNEKAKAAGFTAVNLFGIENFTDNARMGELMRTLSFVDMEKRHKIGREINILQK